MDCQEFGRYWDSIAQDIYLSAFADSMSSALGSVISARASMEFLTLTVIRHGFSFCFPALIVLYLNYAVAT